MNKVSSIIYRVTNHDSTEILDGIVKYDDCPMFKRSLPRWLSKGYTVEMRHYMFPKDLSDAANNS